MARPKGVKDGNRCVDCVHFKIVYGPIGKCKNAWDLGMAECRKHHKSVDFISRAELDKLRCVEGGDKDV